MKWTCDQVHCNPVYHETVDLYVRSYGSTEDEMLTFGWIKGQEGDAELKRGGVVRRVQAVKLVELSGGGARSQGR